MFIYVSFSLSQCPLQFFLWYAISVCISFYCISCVSFIANYDRNTFRISFRFIPNCIRDCVTCCVICISRISSTKVCTTQKAGRVIGSLPLVTSLDNYHWNNDTLLLVASLVILYDPVLYTVLTKLYPINVYGTRTILRDAYTAW